MLHKIVLRGLAGVLDCRWRGAPVGHRGRLGEVAGNRVRAGLNSRPPPMDGAVGTSFQPRGV